jgi:phage head maturation protease
MTEDALDPGDRARLDVTSLVAHDGEDFEAVVVAGRLGLEGESR